MAVLAVAVAVGVAAPALLERHQLLILVVGLPHGAVDHLVPFWTGWTRRSVLVMPGPGLRVLLAGVVAGCVLLAALASMRRRGRRTAVEVVLLAVLFVAVPPLAAFGIYFGARNGLQYTARLIACDPRNHADLTAGRLLRPVRRFLVSAALPTLVAGGSAAALVAIAGQHADLTGTVFTVLLFLTVPHLVVVAALDLAGLRRSRLTSAVSSGTASIHA